jgi:hypothetical protein
MTSIVPKDATRSATDNVTKNADSDHDDGDINRWNGHGFRGFGICFFEIATALYFFFEFS